VGAPVVASTLDWSEEEFETLELEVGNEDFVLFRRRHIDNLREKKTFRRYVIAARQVNVSKLGNCLIVASYKENPKVELLEGESGDWRDYRQPLAERRKKDKKQPIRWNGKVLACTDPTLSAREVVEWYEIRWQSELFFRELKSRMQMRCYVPQAASWRKLREHGAKTIYPAHGKPFSAQPLASVSLSKDAVIRDVRSVSGGTTNYRCD
jgi:hypothetical protein